MNKINAACIIIGDEVLNGKINDTNSRYFAQFCFRLGIKLREIITIGDDEEQIMTTLRNLKEKYQFIITTGGIGSTHDDITYKCVAKSFNLPCMINEQCKLRMQEKSNPEGRLSPQALSDYYKMATLPSGPTVKNYYLYDDLWVPVCSLNQQVFIFPGIPQLFERLLSGLTPIVKSLYHLGEKDIEYVRYFIKTSMTESQISHNLKLLQEDALDVSSEIKIGSYPHYGKGFNTISILGEKKDDKYLLELMKRAEVEFEGQQLSTEEEDEVSNTR
ncbi:similar to Saccharomyces cerevisiae YMR178W Putative protein of unknown function [Maudiozyma barnettii]|uniref:MoaB/Mog domain-containing protein n=1 Tax=Maudiozyma barnettii TaxID=61262 RepID=A0A8H2VFM1_9SACH|nr:Fpy1p [Kazachstania barnettii]CAB4254308.1 similar to Saccharomyces cerevisiae YMR178W Putative protein of unknown function [Kazachstania barnettii]CAD1782127.1 similar to Saccharomyces cerevisiae YMR178W Putative protein of unknown function [Kazachstania barnettii]